MKRLGNIVGLCSISVAVYALLALAVTFASCGTTIDVPLDDAYIYPEKTTKRVSTASQSTPTTSSTPSTPTTSGTSEVPAPSLEIISAQDTTITVKIKR